MKTIDHPLSRVLPAVSWPLIVVGLTVILAFSALAISTGVPAKDPAPARTGVPASPAAAAGSSASPKVTPTAPSTPTASPKPAPGASEVLTAENSPELAEVLKSSDSCGGAIPKFVATHEGRVIAFAGHVGDITPRQTARFDFLIGAGDFTESLGAGPEFQFSNVDSGAGLRWVGGAPDAVTIGLNLQVTAKVVGYEPKSCLVLLTPVETGLR